MTMRCLPYQSASIRRRSRRAPLLLINLYNRKYFDKAVSAQDLKSAALWLGNVGRSLSLGDFYLVDLGRDDFGSDFKPDQTLFPTIIERLIAAEEEIVKRSSDRSLLLFCCSGPNSEVEYWWGAVA
jgi:hypothetical protein